MKLIHLLKWVPESKLTRLGAGVKNGRYPWETLTPIQKAEKALLNPERDAGLDLPDCGALFRYLASQGGQETRRTLERAHPEAPALVKTLLEHHVLFERNAPPAEGPQAIVFLPDEFAGEIPLNANELTTLANLLNQQKSEYFSLLATRYGLERGQKFWTLQQAKERLLSRDLLERIVQKLDAAQRRLWDACVKKGGVLEREDLRALNNPYPSFNVYGRPSDALNQLYHAALFFPDKDYDCRAIFIPFGYF